MQVITLPYEGITIDEMQLQVITQKGVMKDAKYISSDNG